MAFGTVATKLGKLHYEVKLDDGRTWKRHIEQMNRECVNTNRQFGDIYHSNSGNVTSDTALSENDSESIIPQNSNSDRSRTSSEGTEDESEEGVMTKTDPPHAMASAQTDVIVNEQQSNAISEGRPQRNRKPPERYGNHLQPF